MILVDAGPLVALFDATDRQHAHCVDVLGTLKERVVTTTPVLTESFHLLRPAKSRASGLVDFVNHGGLDVLPVDDRILRRSFELMLQYADLPMDFADATLVSAAEHSRIDKVFTLDRKHFTVYRMKRGHRHVPFTLVGEPDKPWMVHEGADPDVTAGCLRPESRQDTVQSRTGLSANAINRDVTTFYGARQGSAYHFRYAKMSRIS